MKIIGTGLDIVEISRIRSLAQKEPRFLKRVFGPRELEYSLKSKKRWERLAVRFAAKEAAWKALGQKGLALKDIQVERLENGKPVLDLKALKLPAKWKADITLSHSDNYAVAFCLVYRA